MTAALDEVLSIDEVVERFPDEWILLQVTAVDQYHAASEGIVLAHHPRRGVLQRHIMKQIAKHREGMQYYIFQAYPHRWSKERWTEILARAALTDGA